MTREVRGLPLGGEVCIATQRQLPNGEWLHVSARWEKLLSMDQITYIEPQYGDKENRTPDNAEAVLAFIGEQPKCPDCGGYGEYETEHGPKGCNECCSRLIPFIDFQGHRVGADWGDTIERRQDGLHLIRKEEPTMTEPNHSQRGHARLAPSNSKCWTTCTASVAFIAANADRVKEGDTRYADEGTQAHEFCDAVLNGKMPLEEVPNGKEIDFPEDHVYRGKDFRTHVTTYVEHCRELAGDDMMDIELQVPLFYAPEDTGTMDFACVKSEDLLYVRDLKYGAGVFVDAVDNTQLAIYALSTVRMFQDDGLYSFHPGTIINIGIVQPRYHGDEPIRTWELTLSDLEVFCREIEYAAIQIREGRGLKFQPSEEGCRWCKAKGFCKARGEWAAAALEYDGGSGIDVLRELPDLTKEESKMDVEQRIEVFTDGGGLDDATLVALFERSKAITSFLSDVAEFLSERVQGGEKIEGLKLVMGREGNREFNDEEAADKLVAGKLKAEERYKPKQLLSPTQLEAKLKEALTSTRFKNRWDSLVSRSPAKTVVALESDKRVAVTATVDALPDLTDNDGL